MGRDVGQRRRLLAAVLVGVLSLVPLSQRAYAGWTYDACDIDVKYWCYAVYYTTFSGGVTVENRYYWGGLGNGGAVWWRRWITQDWHYDFSSWYFLQGWAPGDIHTSPGTESVFGSRSIANEGVVRMQLRFKSTGQGIEWCDGYVDWHLSDGGYYYMQGPYGCLTPIY